VLENKIMNKLTSFTRSNTILIYVKTLEIYYVNEKYWKAHFFDEADYCIRCWLSYLIIASNKIMITHFFDEVHGLRGHVGDLAGGRELHGHATRVRHAAHEARVEGVVLAAGRARDRRHPEGRGRGGAEEEYANRALFQAQHHENNMQNTLLSILAQLIVSSNEP
jgi:hypothetical protein